MTRTLNGARVAGIASLALTTLATGAPTGVAGAAGQARLRRAISPDLGGQYRYLTQLSTDKQLYRAGETVYVRGVLLHAHTHAPLPDGYASGWAQVKGPGGDTIASGNITTQDSVAAFAWPIPNGAPDGEYTVRLESRSEGQAPAERRFEVRATRPPRLMTRIVFVRHGYGPGDTVDALLHSERARGGIPRGATVTAVARLDGTEIHRSTTSLDAKGNCSVRFALPTAIDRGHGTLAMIVEDGGVKETASRTIPILLPAVELTLYPEGGRLVAGVPTRVYLEARTPAQQPAEIAAAIVDDTGRTIMHVKTEHEGRGRFGILPEPNRTYSLKIVKPSGIRELFDLPPVEPSGAVIATIDDVTGPNRPVRLHVAGTVSGTLTLTLSQRAREVAAAAVVLEGADAPRRVVQTSLLVPPEVSGVLVATLWSEEGEPLAERLVFRQPREVLRVAVTAHRKRYVTGDEVELTVETTDASGVPVSAVVGMTVTDESAIEMVDERERAPRLPVMVLLENDVRELADAHVYLDPDNPKAPLAIDLLLGTQGWRRFAFVDPTSFIARYEDAARRVLALRMLQQQTGQRRDLEAAIPLAAAGRGKAGAVASSLSRPQPRAATAKKPPPRARVAESRALDGARWVARARGRRSTRVRNFKTRPRTGGMVWIRQYAHPYQPNRRRRNRTDVTETVFWTAGVRTNAKTGTATVRFALSDSVTTYRVAADAFDLQGTLGSTTAALESIEPLSVEPTIPLQVSSGDVLLLPVAVTNVTAHDLRGGTLTAKAARGIKVTGGGHQRLTFPRDSRQRHILRVATERYVGTSDVAIRAFAGGFRDSVTRSLDVQPLGFPIEVGHGGILEPGATQTFQIDIPRMVARGSLTTDIAVYPTVLASMTRAAERLTQEPLGCSEQTTSVNYLLVMAQQYLRRHAGNDPALIERSRRLLDKGYARLASFECNERGYDWFGVDPADAALSAYALLQLTQMQQVYPIDRALLDRARSWILTTRDGRGGFERGRRALQTWPVEPDLRNGYTIWALLTSGETQLDKEVSSFKWAAARSRDSYVTALGANVAALDGDTALAKLLMERLAAKQTTEGWVHGAETSIVGSGGVALQVETTALATLAWLGDPAFAGPAEKGIAWLAESCRSGRYGSTQSTALALRAIAAHDHARPRPRAAGSVQVMVDGRTVGRPVLFGAQIQGPITLPDIAPALRRGRRRVDLKMTRGSRMPFSLLVRYNALQPNPARAATVAVQTRLKHRRLLEGAITEIEVGVRNLSDTVVPMPVAIVGVPGGLQVRHEPLEELTKAGRVAAYEVVGRDLVLYWRELRARQVVRLPVSAVAAVPGTYTGPASRSYPYYADELKRWAPGIKVEIEPRGR